MADQEEKLTHWKKLTNPDYIGAYELQPNKDLIVEITGVKREMVTGSGGKKEECTVVSLKNHKPLVLNSTNARAITKVAGTPHIEKWKGTKISLYVAYIKAFGEDNVEAIRVRDEPPEAPELPELTPKHEKWQAAKDAMDKGNTTIEAIKKKYKLTPANEKKLCSK